MRWLNNLKTAALLGGMMGLCLLIGWAVGGATGLLLGLLFGGIGNIVSFYYSDKIAIAAMRGQEVTPEDAPELYRMLERLSDRAGIPTPRLYVCPQEAPNAFATGRSPEHAAVAVSSGMLNSFPLPEVEGVIAHELAHIKHRDVLISTVASVLAGIISYAGYMAFYLGGSRRDNPLGPIGMLLMVMLAPLAAAVIQMAISRQREYAADSYGGELCGDPRKLAYALRRLDSGNRRVPTDTPPAFHNLYIAQPLSGQGLASLFSTHPPIEDRIARLEAQARG